MEYKEFIKLVQHGVSFPKDSIPMLQKFASEFPYFQTAHALLAKSMHDHQDVRYDRQLKYASAYATDRKALHKLIHYRPTGVFAIATEESPFIHESAIEDNKLIVPPSEPQIIPDFLPEELSSVLAEPEITIQQPLIEAETTPQPSDPQEILKRRLEEILGKHVDKKEEQAIPIDKPIIAEENKSEDLQTAIKENTAVTPEVHEVFELKSKEVISTPSSENALAETESTNENIPVADNIEAVNESVPSLISAKENIEELISIESEKAVDPVQKEQLEIALESAILDSLEKLPVIKKEETASVKSTTSEITSADTFEVTGFNFIDWLKSKSNSGFGQVELVHADNQVEEIASKAQVITEAKKSVHEESEAEITVEKPIEKQPDTEKGALIDKFIASEPRIVPSKQEFYSPANQARKSISENEDIVSETLARIYYQQGNLLKARSAYEKLSLFYPEKKTYFAALIKEIDAQFNNLNKQEP